MIRKSLKSNQVVISPSNVEIPTCSYYEVNRLELYNEYNSGFDFRLKKTLNTCSSYHKKNEQFYHHIDI